ASGSIGKAITQALLETGLHTITALTRSTNQTPLPFAIPTIPIDYTNPTSLTNALINQDCLIITLSVYAPPDTQSKLISAASAAGIKYIMPNIWGCDVMHDPLAKGVMYWDRMRSVLSEIEEKGMIWTALVCGFWYEHSLLLGPGGLGFDFANRKVTMYDEGDTRINVSTQGQCGRAVARLLSLKILPEDEEDEDEGVTMSRWANRPVYVSSFLVSQRDVFESWLRVTGEEREGWTVEREESKRRYERGMELLGKGDQEGFVLAMFARVFFPNGDGDHEHRVGLDNEVLGLPGEDLDERTRVARAMLEGGWDYFSNRVSV
ncbi:aromatic alcohol reductase, partial [Aspergillus ibericus CBS 121593]